MTTCGFTVIQIGRKSFPGLPASVSDARTWAAEVLGNHDVVIDDLPLLVSELATNAVLHTFSYGRDFEVVIGLSDDRVVVEVLDAGSTTEPVVKKASGMSPRGRGLMLVEALADSWGTRQAVTGGRSVWFEMSRHG